MPVQAPQDRSSGRHGAVRAGLPGGIEYRKTPVAGTFRIEAIYHEEGRYSTNVDASNTFFLAQGVGALRDHPGSTRPLLFADKGGDGMVEVTRAMLRRMKSARAALLSLGPSYGGSHWMNDAARDNMYQFNGIERNQDFAVNFDLADFRSYDGALGRWVQIDPLAEIAPDWSPYRFGFDNPISYWDPLGLFESREEARNYKREHKEEGRVKRQKDGSFAIENRKGHSFIAKGDEGEIIEGALVEGRGVHLRDIGIDAFNELSNPYSESYNPNAFIYTDAADIAYAFGEMLGFALPSAKVVSASQTVSAARGATQYSDDFVKVAQKVYPKKAGKIEFHHPVPKYLGGIKNQKLVPL
ncbi:MAG: hypothetical protein IPH16_14440, partial [Haliscomenobacter sp.]|nr:hypothetical protein [Haliscomenobacter sp.]